MKSVSSLFARKPKPGTTRPAPPVDSIVNVYATTLPQRSAVVMCVVVPARVSRRGGLDARAAAAVERIRIPGRDRARRGRLRDQRAPRGREPVGEQPRQRDVEVRRIGEIGAAVGERVARGLDEVVQRRLARHRRERVALEDVQRLADGRAAARGRAHAVHVEPAVADARRRALGRRVGVQVAHRHEPGPPGVVGGRRHDRVLHGLDERVRDRTAVEALRPEVRDPRVRAREVGVAEDGADVVRRAVRVEVERGGRGDVVEPVDVGLRLVEERLVDDEAVARDPDRRRERVRERDRAVPLERLVPRLDGAGHADGEAAVARVVEGKRRAVLPEGVGAHRGRCGLAAVDRGHLAVACAR